MRNIFPMLRSPFGDTPVLLSTRDEKILFGASLCVALVFVALTIFSHGLFQPFTEIKSDAYLPLAVNLHDLYTFSYSTTSPFRLETTHVPGYPFFLSLAAVPFGSIVPALMLQAFLFSISVIFLYRLVQGVVPRSVAFFGALLYGIEPFTGFIVASALSEALFMFLFLGGLYLCRRAFEEGSYSFSLFAGLFFSLSVLVRPIALYVIPLFVLFSLLFLPRTKKLLLLMLTAFVTFILPLSLWVARNEAAYGVWSLSTKGPYTVYFWDIGQLLEYREGWSARETEEYLVGRVRETYPEVHTRKDLRDPRYATFLNETSFEILLESPLLYAKVHALSMATFFLSDGYRLLADELGAPFPPLPNITKAVATGALGDIVGYFAKNPGPTTLFILGFTFWGSVTVLAFLAGVFIWRKGEGRVLRLFIALCLVVMIAFAGLTGPVAQARYRIVVTPFLFMLAAYSALALRDTLRTMRENA